MTATTSFDLYMDQAAQGTPLPADAVRELASAPDILSLGMIADALRRHVHGRRTTFLRVAESSFERPFADGVPELAGELRVTGEPGALESATKAIATAKSLGGGKTVAAFSWSDVERWSAAVPLADVLRSLKSAGLDALVEVAIDAIDDPERAIGQLVAAGFGQLRLSVRKAPGDARAELWLAVRRWQDACAGAIQTINPLPSALSTFRPTTGYEDVKMVAVARLAAPNVPSIQVDWRRYGPKLAQVALTFGADDLDGISPSDAAPEGRRRAPLAEIQRNIEAAGLVAVERDGRFVVRA